MCDHNVQVVSLFSPYQRIEGIGTGETFETIQKESIEEGDPLWGEILLILVSYLKDQRQLTKI